MHAPAAIVDTQPARVQACHRPRRGARPCRGLLLLRLTELRYAALVASLVSKLRNLAALSPADRRVVVEAAGALPAMALSLHVVRMTSLFARLDRLADRVTTRVPPADPVPLIRRTRGLVALAARRGFYRGNCLSRSATLWWLLRRQGIRTDVRIGVRKEDGDLVAHAWVERDGMILNDRADTVRRYIPFAETLTR